jgi:hypothetical protein
MGSLGGHMSHLWEDQDLTFGDINSILYEACKGDLRATEKFDGINVHFRVDTSGDLRFSTSGKQRDVGGLSQSQFASLMEGHPAEQTFVDGAEALFRLTKNSFWPFGFSGRNWINCDLINKHRPMTVDYDENAIVFHGVRNFHGESSGTVAESFTRYAGNCSNFSVVVNGNEWRVSPPVEINLPDLMGEGIISNFESSLNKLMTSAGCNKNSSLRDFARFTLESGVVSKLKISEDKKRQLVSHVFRDGGTSLVKIKKGLPSNIASQVSEIGSAKNRNKIIGEAMLPIEIVITYAGAKILENVKSALIEDATAEKERLGNSVQAAIMLVESCSDNHGQARKALIERYVNKFELCGGLTSSIEGIVFQWHGEPYKITGNFAPINHILGIPRYGRGKIPPVEDGIALNEIAKEIQMIKLMGRF